jgi:hypothetical protein
MATRTLALALVIVSTMLLPGIAVRQVKHAGARQAAKSDTSQTESGSSILEQEIDGALWKTDEEYLAATGMARTRTAAGNGTTDICPLPKQVCCCNRGASKGEFQHPAKDYRNPSKSETCLTHAITCTRVDGPTCVGHGFDLPLVDMRMCSELPPISDKLAGLKVAADMYKTDKYKSEETVDFLTILENQPNEKPVSRDISTRDYTIIVDRSASMGETELIKMPEEFAEITKKGDGKNKVKMPKFAKAMLHEDQDGKKKRTLWMQARGALAFLAPAVVAEDPDGIGLYFFDTCFEEAKNICDAEKAGHAFDVTQPQCDNFCNAQPLPRYDDWVGCTNLAPVLKEAMEPDTIGRAETIFVITDGRANDEDAVKKVISDYTQKMCRAEMLSISFIQVGHNSDASDYLDYLDDKLVREMRAKFDIVDALSYDEMKKKGLTFLEVLEKSLND